MKRNATNKMEERLERALKRLPLDPGPFREEWLDAEPETIVDVLPRKRFPRAWLAAAAVLLAAISSFFLINREDPDGLHKPAVVLLRTGSVVMHRGSEAVPLQPGFRLQKDDTVTVPANARLDLRMPDGSLMQIRGEAEIRLASLNRRIVVEQKMGRSYHSVADSSERIEFTVETPTAIASVRGTRFVVENSLQATTIRVTEGSVQTTVRRPGPEEESSTSVLHASEEVEIEQNTRILKKKSANTTADLVIFNELSRQRDLWSPEVMQQVEIMEATTDQGEIEKIYDRPLETLYMTDGRVLKGVVAAQVDRTLILHTTEGVIAVPIEELQEIRFDRE